MYNDDIKFHSSRDYPAIVASGSKSFSISSTANITLTSASSNEDYFVFVESGGYLYSAAPFNSPVPYVESGLLRLHMPTYSPISGIIHWRKYGS